MPTSSRKLFCTWSNCNNLTLHHTWQLSDILLMNVRLRCIYTLCFRLCDTVGAIKMDWIRNIISLVILQITLFITKRQSHFNLMIFKMLPASAWCHTTCCNALPGSNWTCFAPFISAIRTNIVWIVSLIGFNLVFYLVLIFVHVSLSLSVFNWID